MSEWSEWRAAATKVLLALVPSLFKVLWDHWPKTPPERRVNEARSTGDGDTPQVPPHP